MLSLNVSRPTLGRDLHITKVWYYFNFLEFNSVTFGPSRTYGKVLQLSWCLQIRPIFTDSPL